MIRVGKMYVDCIRKISEKYCLIAVTFREEVMHTLARHFRFIVYTTNEPPYEILTEADCLQFILRC